MLEATIHREHREDVLAVQILPPSCLFSYGGQQMQILEGMDRKYVPLNNWIHETLQPCAERIIYDKNRYTLVFDKLEILIALSSAYHEKKSADQDWIPTLPSLNAASVSGWPRDACYSAIKPASLTPPPQPTPP